jgi:hypothetical protein
VPAVPPAGVTPISLFLETNFTSPSGVVGWLADPIDVATGDYLSIEKGFDPVDAAVLTAFRTVRGSGSAVEQVGQDFAAHPRVDPQLEPFMREEVRLAVKNLTDAGDVAIQKVTVTPYGDTADIYVEWSNISREKSQGITLAPNLLVGAS